MQSRRRVLRGIAAVSGSLGLAGCVTSISGTTDTPTDPATDELNVEHPEPVSEATFTAWEPDTNCNNGEQESMYNSEISVQTVLGEQPASINPIPYEDLPDEQKQILAEVLAVGGYATCDISEAFQAFVETAVYEYADEQEGDTTSVYLAYDGDYYKLYIRKQDQVFAY